MCQTKLAEAGALCLPAPIDGKVNTHTHTGDAIQTMQRTQKCAFYKYASTYKPAVKKLRILGAFNTLTNSLTLSAWTKVGGLRQSLSKRGTEKDRSGFFKVTTNNAPSQEFYILQVSFNPRVNSGKWRLLKVSGTLPNPHCLRSCIRYCVCIKVCGRPRKRCIEGAKSVF